MEGRCPTCIRSVDEREREEKGVEEGVEGRGDGGEGEKRVER
jgi:hypothetical protein